MILTLIAIVAFGLLIGSMLMLVLDCLQTLLSWSYRNVIMVLDATNKALSMIQSATAFIKSIAELAYVVRALASWFLKGASAILTMAYILIYASIEILTFRLNFKQIEKISTFLWRYNVLNDKLAACPYNACESKRTTFGSQEIPKHSQCLKS